MPSLPQRRAIVHLVTIKSCGAKTFLRKTSQTTLAYIPDRFHSPAGIAKNAVSIAAGRKDLEVLADAKHETEVSMQMPIGGIVWNPRADKTMQKRLTLFRPA